MFWNLSRVEEVKTSLLRFMTNLEAEEETLRRGAVGGGAVGEVGDATDEGGEATGGEATGEATGGEATGGIT